MEYKEIAKIKFEELKNKKDIYVLGIESSCDETGISIVKNGREIISNIVSTQIDIHKRFGGVVPEIASRNHIMQINNCLDLCLKQANMTLDDIDLIAVTYGAGLIGALMVGVNFAKGLAFSLNKPLIKVDHIKGHICANYLCFSELKPPFLCLLASGAHTEILKVKDYNDYELIGQSLDDACGECFDKVARVLGLEYPGGPKIEKLAEQGNDSISFIKENKDLKSSYNFSYSGLKTAVINYIHTQKQSGKEINKPDICASFQKNAFSSLIEKTIRASLSFGKDYSNIAIAGGVSANQYLRKTLLTEAEKYGLKVYFPKLSLCTDNGAMIASCGYFNFIKNENLADLTLCPKARI